MNHLIPAALIIAAALIAHGAITKPETTAEAMNACASEYFKALEVEDTPQKRAGLYSQCRSNF